MRALCHGIPDYPTIGRYPSATPGESGHVGRQDSGAFAGRWVCDAVQQIGGDGWATALAAAAGGSTVAAFVVGSALLGLDRGVVRYVLQVEREPIPPSAPVDPAYTTDVS